MPNVKDSINAEYELLNAFGNGFVPTKDLPDYKALLPKDYESAEWQYEKICEQIKDFQDSLDDEHEVALLLTNFGQSIILNVTNLGYQNPCLIYYYGYSNGNRCQLIQHISQINFLLMSVPKPDPNKPARRVVIGFHDREE